MPGKDTPLGIILIGIFFTLFGLASIYSGFGFAFYPSWAGSYGLYLGAGLLIAGIIELVFGVGFLLGRPWAWKAGVVILACGVLMQGFIMYGWMQVSRSLTDIQSNFWSYFSIAVTCIMLWYLFLPHVKSFYGRI
jgi:hypothetical protein